MAKGHNHILMARCINTKRADEVFEVYKKYKEFNPVQIHMNLPARQLRENKQKILSLSTRIIICVDMLGEGFDLPELKVAAFHDIKKSLPVTLQLAGRFTRTNIDNTLGEATFVANLADINTKNELDELYAQDADWNTLLPRLSTTQIENEVKFAELFKGFDKMRETTISFQNIRPALSAIVYSSRNPVWNPSNYRKGLQIHNDDIVFHNINYEENILVIIVGKKFPIEWGSIKDINNIAWNLFIVYFDKPTNLLFIHSSDNSSLYVDLAHAVIGSDATKIDKIVPFKIFGGLKRIRLQNVGLKEFLGKNIRFRMSVGNDVDDALSLVEKQKAQKAFVFGIGYENGFKRSLGCSYKGRIWSRMNGDLLQFIDWSRTIARKLIDPKIDPNIFLKDTIIPQYVIQLPDSVPFWIDWSESLYMESETKVQFVFNGSTYDLNNCELMVLREESKNNFKFRIITIDNQFVELSLTLLVKNNAPDFSINITQSSFLNMTVKLGQKEFDLSDFFYEHTPAVWFADGSCLIGNEYVELKQILNKFDKDKIQAWNWDGIDISVESQGVEKNPKSIQYRVIQVLKKKDYDIIYDDDDRGEIADIVTIKKTDRSIEVEMYHLKYARKGDVNKQIENLYEVCGQAQKSIKWKHKEGYEFFNHLLRRKTKKSKDTSCSRIELGDEQKLITYMQMAKRLVPMNFTIYIVQPSLSPSDISDDQLTILGVTENYLHEIGGVSLTVIANENKT